MSAMFKRIYATVTGDTFAKFAGRCRKENIDIGDGLAAIVKAYAQGAVIAMPKKQKQHAKPTGASYGKD